jgi:hypothetical protein
MKATLATGQLVDLKGKCFISIPALSTTIPMQSLPDIGDNKGATYADEPGIGRSMPYKTYQSSENRTISWTAHFMVTQPSDIATFQSYIRAIQAAVYPFNSGSDGAGGAPYTPPPICQIRCGQLLDMGLPVNAILKSYALKYDTSVPWDEDTFLPYKFDIDMQFDVVYDQVKLPGANQIFTGVIP